MVVEPIEALEAQEVVEVLVEEDVEEELWVPSTLRHWKAPATFTINLGRKLGRVLTGSTVQ